MRLAAKLVLLFLVGLLLIVGLFSYLTIQQDRRLALAEHQRYASDLAATLQPSILEEMRQSDQRQLPQSITQSTRQVRHVRVRWVQWSNRSDGAWQPSVPGHMIVSKTEVTTISMPDPTGREVLYTYVPVEGDGDAGDGEAGSIEVSAPNIDSAERFHRSVVSSLLALLGVATLSGIVIWVGGVLMVGKPLNQLIQKVDRVGRGDFSGPVQLESADELGGLGLALNRMCDQLAEQRQKLEAETSSRIATLEQLRHSDRLSTVGRMAAGIAHEIGTPLNVVSGRAELIAGGQLSEDATRQSAQAIKSEAQRIAKIIRELLDFARQTTPHPARRSLNEIIQLTANLMRPLAARHGTEIQLAVPQQTLDAEVDSGQIQQVLSNLIVNAVQSTGDNGRATISLSNANAKPPGNPNTAAGAYRKISIRDNGSGISPSDREHIFEPFFTTKDVGDGTGLGLSISHGIVHEHGGWIEVESEPGQGSCFSVYLPAAIDHGEPSDE